MQEVEEEERWEKRERQCLLDKFVPSSSVASIFLLLISL